MFSRTITVEHILVNTAQDVVISDSISNPIQIQDRRFRLTEHLCPETVRIAPQSQLSFSELQEAASEALFPEGLEVIRRCPNQTSETVAETVRVEFNVDNIPILNIDQQISTEIINSIQRGVAHIPDTTPALLELLASRFYQTGTTNHIVVTGGDIESYRSILLFVGSFGQNVLNNMFVFYQDNPVPLLIMLIGSLSTVFHSITVPEFWRNNSLHNIFYVLANSIQTGRAQFQIVYPIQENEPLVRPNSLEGVVPQEQGQLIAYQEVPRQQAIVEQVIIMPYGVPFIAPAAEPGVQQIFVQRSRVTQSVINFLNLYSTERYIDAFFGLAQNVSDEVYTNPRTLGFVTLIFFTGTYVMVFPDQATPELLQAARAFINDFLLFVLTELRPIVFRLPYN